VKKELRLKNRRLSSLREDSTQITDVKDAIEILSDVVNKLQELGDSISSSDNKASASEVEAANNILTTLLSKLEKEAAN